MLVASTTQKPSSPNPRRVAAHLSVSLYQDRAPSSNSRSASPRHEAGTQTKVTATRHDSQESGKSSDSNVENWFERSNSKPEKGCFPGSHQNFDSNDPPFFLTRSSSGGTSNNDASIPRPRPTNLIQAATKGSSSAEDYRSVIDDLTIENRKLKRRLRKYERPHPSQLEKDKMFELKIHGLPARKRGELENVLRVFASSVDGSIADDSRTSKDRRPQYDSSGRQDSSSTSNTKHTPSSSTSNSRPVDSAYASMSTSGPTSTSTHKSKTGHRSASQTKGEKEKKIHNFLHNIPEGLFPSAPPMMNERQKKRHVVQRLEQLFTGKRGVKVGVNSQPLQQQEVSNSAARADQVIKGGVVEDEGSREAPILSEDTDGDNSKPEKMDVDVSVPTTTSKQRPTRPLDLDPDRAQIPSENVEYIRHLGLSTPKLITEDSHDVEPDADGWVYLNLLINMAQLHIINVTPEFVRSALSGTSEKFQISPDGKKVRWRGGTEGTHLGSDSGSSSTRNRSPHGSSPDANQPSRKRRKVEGKFLAAPIRIDDSNEFGKSAIYSSAFQYTPLFNHQSSSFAGVQSSAESESPVASSAHIGNSRLPSISENVRSAGPRTGRKKRRPHSDGPIVFYNGLNFCTDLSGDRGNIVTPLHVSGMGRDGYSNRAHDALGSKNQVQVPEFRRTTSGSLLPFSPFKDYSIGHDPFKTADNRPRTPECLAYDSDEDPFVHDRPVEPGPSFQAQDFEATGLGGVYPADHFLMHVETRRARSEQTMPKKTLVGKPPHVVKTAVGNRLAALSDRSKSLAQTAFPPEKPSIKTEILSIHYIDLEPSELPPPFGWDATLSSSDGDSYASSRYSGVSHLRHDRTFLHQSHDSFDDRETNPDDVDLEDLGISDSDEMSESDDSSIDMLALARHLNPDGVAEQERTYAMELDDPEVGEEAADREETPWVRSSAATVNDESGYSSVMSLAG